MATGDQQNETSVSPPSPGPVGDAATITLRIHSPSIEVPNPLTLTLVPVTITVRELRLRIRDAIPSRPEVQSQRLIHRGRMLGDDNETMVHVFGQAALDESATQSLHLVLRPVASGSTASMAQTQSEPGLFGPVPHERPASVPPIGLPGPQGLHGAAHLHHHQHHAFHHNLPLPQLFHPPIPHHVRGFLNDHLAAMNQQMAQQSNHPGAIPPIPAPNASGPTQISVPPSHGVTRATTAGPQMRMFQHHVGQNQRARAAAGMRGIHNHNGDEHNQSRTENTTTHPSNPGAAHGVGNGSIFPGFSSLHTRGAQGPPDGHRWQVTVNESTVTVPFYPNSGEPSPTPNHHITSGLGGPNNIGPSIIPGMTLGHTAASQIPEPPPGISTRGHLEALFNEQHERFRTQSQALISRLDRMEAGIRAGNLPPLDSITEARSELAAVIAAEEVLRHEMGVRRSGLSAATRRLQSRNTGQDRAAVPNHDHNGHPLRLARSVDQLRATPSPPAWRFDNLSAPAGSSTTLTHPPPASVYLLSSPTGPNGLVFSPTGLYTTQAPDQTLAMGIPNGPSNIRYGQFTGSNLPYGGPGFGQTDPFPRPDFAAQIGGTNPFMTGQPGFGSTLGQNHPWQPPAMPQPRQRQHHQHQQPQTEAPPAHQGQQQQQHQQGQPQQPQAHAQAEPNNQVRDLLRVLLPLGGHLWLLIRLAGFVFFFGGGAGWRRTIMILLGALMIFITQTGIFAGIQEAIMGPVRRHIEGLLPLAADGHGRPNQPGNPAAAVVPEGAPQPRADAPTERGQQQGAIDPTESAATGYVEERQRRGWLIEQIRRVERAILIFIASLVPGVGERHIAARQQAAQAAAAAAAPVVAPPSPPVQEQERERQAPDTNVQTETQQEGESGENNEEAGSGAAQEYPATISAGDESNNNNNNTQADPQAQQQNQQQAAAAGAAVQPLVEI